VTRFDGGSLDAATSVAAVRVIGRWPDDAWIERLPTLSHDGEDITRWSSIGHWSSGDWPSPRVERPIRLWNEVRLLEWQGARMLAATAIAASESRGCLVFQTLRGNAVAPSPICTAEMGSSPFRGGTTIPGQNPCQLWLSRVDVNADGELDVEGELCALGTRAVWRRGGWRRAVPRLTPRDGHADDDVAILHLPRDEAYVARILERNQPTPRLTVDRCTRAACKLHDAAPLPGETLDEQRVPPELFPGEGAGSFFVLAGHQLFRGEPRARRLEREPLPIPVQSLSPTAGVPRWAVADADLFERSASGWARVALPRWKGTPLAARKVVSRGDDLWVIADYAAGGCRRGEVLLRRAPGGPTLYCDAGALRPEPPADPPHRVVMLNDGTMWSVRETVTQMPPELRPHVRVVRRLGRGFHGAMAADTEAPDLVAAARAIASRHAIDFDNPLCVAAGDLGSLDELPPEDLPPDAGAGP
jgi:hypothetical protein